MKTLQRDRFGDSMFRKIFSGAGALLLITLLLPLLTGAAPQMDSATLGAQNLRSYWHVFIAYALAWLLIFGWIFSVARRLTRIERRLGG